MIVSDVTKQGGSIEVAVADNGLGIQKQHQALIFAPFQRLHGSAVSGSGIGLATCKRIMDRHGGRIWVESAGLGEGATFHLAFEN